MKPLKGSSSHVVLRGSKRFHRAGAVVLGRSDRTERCEITVKVSRQKKLPEPNPDKPISLPELSKEFGADPEQLTKVETALAPYGIAVISRDARTRSVKLAGPVSAMEDAFGLHLFRVKHDDRVYRGRVGEIHIPKELDGIVTGVFGLDTRRMTKHRRPLGAQAVDALPLPNQRSWYLPQELANAYGFPSGDGNGQTIGILEFGGRYIASDLETFWQLAGLPGAIPKVEITNVNALSSQDRNDPGAIGETMLDVEVAAGICPKALIKVYFSTWTEKGWIDNLDAVLADSAVPAVLSISYGLAEGADIWTQQAMDDVNDTLKEFANAGITVCVSTGDDGSDDQVGDGRAHVSFPSCSDNVLAVGGTALDKSVGSEVVWFEGDGLRRDNGGSTGGGVSEVIARPTWQSQINITSANPHAPAGRVLPDISANAAGGTGYFMVSQGDSKISGGTSAATPLCASLIARLLQRGKNIGFLTPRLYAPTAKTENRPLGAVACSDITQGSNASGATEGYSATVGFDAVSGWGTPTGKLVDLLP